MQIARPSFMSCYIISIARGCELEIARPYFTSFYIQGEMNGVCSAYSTHTLKCRTMQYVQIPRPMFMRYKVMSSYFRRPRTNVGQMLSVWPARMPMILYVGRRHMLLLYEIHQDRLRNTGGSSFDSPNDQPLKKKECSNLHLLEMSGLGKASLCSIKYRHCRSVYYI